MSDTELGLMMFALMAVAVLAIGIPVSIHLDEKLHKKRPSAMPFKWGYFYALSGCAALPFAALGLLVGTNGEDILFTLYFAFIGTCGAFGVKRHRWALLCLTIVHFNPVIWIINGVYLANRWKELGTRDEEFAPTDAPPPIPGSISELKSKSFYIAQNGERLGPLTFDRLRTMQKAGVIGADALYWYSGITQWAPMRDNALLANDRE